MDETRVVPYVGASSVMLTPPPDYTPGVFQEGAEVTFMSGAMQPDEFVFEDGTWGAPGTYRATWTIPHIGGSGADSALVSLFGTPMGWAKFTVKSFDTMPVSSSFGTVNLSDLAVFSTHYGSSICDCIWSKPYSAWCDFLKSGDAAHVLADTTIGLPDWSFWTAHYNHTYTAPGYVAASARARASGDISIELTEDQPLLGQRKLRGVVRMRGVEPFVVMMVALKQENPLFRFGRWTPDATYSGTTMCTQVVRNGRAEIMLGVATDGTGGIADAILGHFDIDVLSDDPIVLTDGDFALVLADILTDGGEEKFIYGSGQSYSRILVPATYKNGLAQNYPNPFNPQTTLAYSLKDASGVSLVIYDVAGRRVRELVNEQRKPGVYKVVWDGRDGNGTQVASGVYFYKLVAGSFVDTKKMIMLK